MRRALTLAYNFELANKQLFYGAYTRSRSYFGESDMASTGLPEGDELKLLEKFRGKVPEEVFTESYAPPFYKETPGAKDPFAKAQRTHLRQAMKRGELPSLEEMAASGRAEVYGPSGLTYYATARYLLLYLDQRGALGRFYAELRQGPGTAEAQLELLERYVDYEDWLAWTQRLRR